MNVVLVIFNRPDLTAQVFAAIAQARPERLFIIADGPRDGQDRTLCDATRNAVANVDWECEVHRDYSEVNLGCGRRLPTGLDRVFSLVEDAIILEDDCLPHPDFFRFCDEMLDRFRGDERIGQICGSNFDRGVRRTPYSYSFSNYVSNWGWATWRRSWRLFDQRMALWPVLRQGGWHYDLFRDASTARYFESHWDEVASGRVATVWDGQWMFAMLSQGKVAVRPRTNLVANIGFGANVGATHTTFNHWIASFPTDSLSFPLQHPPFLVVDTLSDRMLARTFYGRVPWWRRALKGCLFNKYWYGKVLRQIPVLGSLWARWRGCRGLGK